MNTFPRSELRTLLTKQTPDCVSASIYIPMIKTGGRDTVQNQQRLKNLLARVEQDMIASGMRRPEALKILKPAHGLLEDSDFWRHRSDGVAIFLSRDFFRYYQAPVAFQELAMVSGRFYIKPLVAMLSGDGQYYILSLSQKQVKLLQCTQFGAKEIDLSGIIPLSLDEFLKYEDLYKPRGYYTSTSIPGTGREGMVAQSKDASTVEKTYLLHYFQQIDQAIRREILKEENAPLVLVAVEYLHAIYREANKYRYLLDEGINGNSEGWNSQQLHEQTWKLVQPNFQKARQEAVNRYTMLLGTGHTSTDINQILPEAYAGRVELLFVAKQHQLWGKFDTVTNKVSADQNAQPCDEDLIDMAVAYALSHKGIVYTMEPNTTIAGSPVAAVFWALQ